MKKIPSLFIRDWANDPGRVTRVVNPDAAWVVAGEGVPTRKWDGTAVLFRGGKMFARFDCKHGRKPPTNVEACQEPDPATGHWPGWVPVDDSPRFKWHREAFRYGMEDGTYELCGPHFQDNPDGLDRDAFIRHGSGLIGPLDSIPRDYDGLALWLQRHVIEGIVWHHPDGRMAKIKRRDFGLPWPAPDPEIPQ
jgi:hypothetical protein